MNNSTLESVNPTDPYEINSLKEISYGQIIILKFDLNLNEPNFSTDLTIRLESSLGEESILIKQIFIRSVGDNFPCTIRMLATNKTYLEIGDVDHAPIVEDDSSANKVKMSLQIQS